MTRITAAPARPLPALPTSASPAAPALLGRLEPLVPVALGLHGLAVLTFLHATVLGWVLVSVVLALGVAGLAGWRDRTAVLIRAVTLGVVATTLQLDDAAYVTHLLQWYYAIVATYPLLLLGRAALAVGPMTAGLYLLSSTVMMLRVTVDTSLVAAILRGAVLLLLGTVVALAGRSYAEWRQRAEDGTVAVGRASIERDRSMALLETYFAHAPVARAFLDRTGRYVQVNTAMERVHGLPAWAVAGRTPAEVFPHVPGMQNIIDRVVDTGLPYGPRDLDVRAPGDVVAGRSWRVSAHPVRVATGSPTPIRVTSPPTDPSALLGVSVLIEDVTEAQRVRRELEHAATHDALTGLPNRTMFAERLADGMRRAIAGGDRLAVLFLDLDRFKTVNDSLGHVAGDQLLIDIARRISDAVRPDDVVCRLGGDEFAVLCEDAGSVGRAEGLATRILRAVVQPIGLAGRPHVVTVSVGIALTTGIEQDPDELLQAADAAMYAAKDAGRNRYAVYDSSMRSRAEELLELEQALRGAVDRGEVGVAYQPVIDIRSGEVVSAEALARWTQPDGHAVPPARFIPLAEELGLLDEVTRLV
ncbi:MAG: diguanylate cyclase, partial [Pseudonocardia sp.]|nr:diguanylate cyclase [Pseudonocardia sp.]